MLKHSNTNMPNFHKDLQHFNQLADSLETKPELLTDYITPNDKFLSVTRSIHRKSALSGTRLKSKGTASAGRWR